MQADLVLIGGVGHDHFRVDHFDIVDQVPGIDQDKIVFLHIFREHLLVEDIEIPDILGSRYQPGIPLCFGLRCR